MIVDVTHDWMSEGSVSASTVEEAEEAVDGDWEGNTEGGETLSAWALRARPGRRNVTGAHRLGLTEGLALSAWAQGAWAGETRRQSVGQMGVRAVGAGTGGPGSERVDDVDEASVY